MPQVQIINPAGYAYSIMSTDADTIAAWFKEWLPKMVSANTTYQWQMRVYPLGMDDDWPVGGQGYQSAYQHGPDSYRMLIRELAEILNVEDILK